jgi:uncharacterized protein involved in exopolysaccharide biosynthesis
LPDLPDRETEILRRRRGRILAVLAVLLLLALLLYGLTLVKLTGA